MVSRNKFHVWTLIAVCLAGIGCNSARQVKQTNVVAAANRRALTVRTTAYSHTESDHIKYGRKSAVGNTLVANSQFNSAAADWSEFPVGTQFRIKGYPKIYVIDDYGRALVGTKTIDIYRPNKKGIKNWGVRFVDIEIIKWGCYAKSAEIISDRQRYAHIRQMKRGIDSKLQLN